MNYDFQPHIKIFGQSIAFLLFIYFFNLVAFGGIWSREGVIINDDKMTLENVILTSRNDVREMQDNVNDPEPTLGADF